MRRLEDKIRGLCARAIRAEKEEELRPLLSELRDALRQHVERIRTRFSDFPLPIERRVNEEVSAFEKAESDASAPQSLLAKPKPIDLDSIQSKIKIPNGPTNGTPSS